MELSSKPSLGPSSPPAWPHEAPPQTPPPPHFLPQEPAFPSLSHPYFPIVIVRRDEKYTGKLMKLKVFSISGTPATRSGHRLRKVYRGRWQIKLIAD